MTIEWTILIIAVLFLGIGVYFILGRASITASAHQRRDQQNRIRPANHQLPASRLSDRQVLAAGIALTVIGLLWLVAFIVSLVQ
jgi:heme O synthase-like polyprenyltransferase